MLELDSLKLYETRTQYEVNSFKHKYLGGVIFSELNSNFLS